MQASGWVVVSPRYTNWGSLKELRLDRLTQNRPQTLSNGERAFRITVQIPESVFDPFASVNITVPEGDLIEPEVEVG